MLWADVAGIRGDTDVGSGVGWDSDDLGWKAVVLQQYPLADSI